MERLPLSGTSIGNSRKVLGRESRKTILKDGYPVYEHTCIQVGVPVAEAKGQHRMSSWIALHLIFKDSLSFSPIG